MPLQPVLPASHFSLMAWQGGQWAQLQEWEPWHDLLTRRGRQRWAQEWQQLQQQSSGGSAPSSVGSAPESSGGSGPQQQQQSSGGSAPRESSGGSGPRESSGCSGLEGDIWCIIKAYGQTEELRRLQQQWQTVDEGCPVCDEPFDPSVDTLGATSRCPLCGTNWRTHTGRALEGWVSLAEGVCARSDRAMKGWIRFVDGVGRGAVWERVD